MFFIHICIVKLNPGSRWGPGFRKDIISTRQPAALSTQCLRCKLRIHCFPIPALRKHKAEFFYAHLKGGHSEHTPVTVIFQPHLPHKRQVRPVKAGIHFKAVRTQAVAESSV